MMALLKMVAELFLLGEAAALITATPQVGSYMPQMSAFKSGLACLALYMTVLGNKVKPASDSVCTCLFLPLLGIISH